MSKFKGQIKGFPKQIVKKMLERQEEQGNKKDVSVFEDNCSARFDTGGFDWDYSPEDVDFWESVILCEDFDIFFKEYPKKKKKKTKANNYPKAMIVADSEEELNACDRKRVVFAEERGMFIAWSGARTLEDAESKVNICAWKFAKDIPKKTVITRQEIADKFGVGIDDLKIEL